MSAEPDDLPDEEAQRGWKDRIAVVAAASGALVQTRLAIFREELVQKLALLAKAAIAVALAIGLAAGVLLLFAAFVAALFTQLFGSAVLGILATLVLFAAGAAGAAFFGIRSLSRVRLTEFPVSGEELRRDWSALRASWASPRATPPGSDSPSDVPPPSRASEDSLGSLEERYRAGAE